MKKDLLFEFIINKEDHTVNVNREFAGKLSLVWDAWTTSELLDQWWAPKPYKVETKSMDFSEGGRWLYAMVSPENEKHWCKNEYIKIVDHMYFDSLDAFCDEAGVESPEMPRTFWTVSFSDNEGVTLVQIKAKYETLSDLEMIIEMGFQEGFTMGLGNLDELLAARI